MKIQNFMVVLASAGLALGMAGCSSSAPKAENTPKPPSVSQVDKQKQQQEAKAKAEAEAKAKAEAEAKAKADAAAKAAAAAKAKAPAPAKAQPKRNYQPKARSYQPKAQPKRHYQAPRRSGGNGTNRWSGQNDGTIYKYGPAGKTVDSGDSRIKYGKDGIASSVSSCGDDQGNTWPC